MNLTEPLCLVCTRPLEHRDKWPGAIKGRFVCLRCSLSTTGFWKDEDDEGWSQEVGFTVADGEAVPLENPRQYQFRKSTEGACSICGRESVVLELLSGRALCARCLSELDSGLEQWRKLKP